MKFISRNPSANFHFIKYNGLKIYLHEDDKTAATLSESKKTVTVKI